jgi:hypothetical protein
MQAAFPSDLIVVESLNLTETAAIGTVAECQAIQVGAADSTDCGSKGAISVRGILPVNMW